MSAPRIPVSGFKECDLRGETGIDITNALAYNLGRAIGTLSPERRAIIGGDFVPRHRTCLRSWRVG